MKTLTFHIIFIITFFSASACDRFDMYTLASSGPRMIYAMSYNGSEAVLVAANLNDYYNEYILTSFTPDKVAASGNGRVVARDTVSQYHSHNSSGFQHNWSLTAVAPGTFKDIEGTEKDIYYLNDSAELWRFSNDTFDWVDLVSLTVPGDPIALDYNRSDNILSIISLTPGSAVYCHRLNSDGTVTELLNQSTGLTTPDFAARAGSTVYLGVSTGIFRIYDSSGETNTTGLPEEYTFTVLGQGRALAVEDCCGTVSILRLNGTAWNPAITIGTGVSPVIHAEPIDRSRIAIGINDTDPDLSGLYIYNMDSGKLSRISPIRVRALTTF